MKTTPYYWRLSANAANGWVKKALAEIEKRMAEIMDSPDRYKHSSELAELSNTYKRMKAAADSLKSQE